MLEAVCTAYGRVCVCVGGRGVALGRRAGKEEREGGRRGGGNRAECVAGTIFLWKSV